MHSQECREPHADMPHGPLLSRTAFDGTSTKSCTNAELSDISSDAKRRFTNVYSDFEFSL